MENSFSSLMAAGWNASQLLVFKAVIVNITEATPNWNTHLISRWHSYRLQSCLISTPTGLLELWQHPRLKAYSLPPLLCMWCAATFMRKNMRCTKRRRGAKSSKLFWPVNFDPNYTVLCGPALHLLIKAGKKESTFQDPCTLITVLHIRR